MIVNLQTASIVSYWKQERLIIYDATYNGWRFWSNLHGSANDPVATYSGAVLYADLTDYMRTYPTATNLFFADNSDPATYKSFAISVKGLINPANVYIPEHALASYYALIIPPSLMYNTFDQNDPGDYEFYKTAGTWSVTSGASLSVDSRHIAQIDGSFTLSDGTQTKTYTPRKMRCGVKYALVKWVSFTGVERKAWFEAVKFKTENAGTYSLLPIDNEYIDIKGRVDGFTLRITGLDVYDLWYYADVINSSKVEVSLDGLTWAQVQVTTKNITLPDGDAGTEGKLDVGVNWRRYDAVAM